MPALGIVVPRDITIYLLSSNDTKSMLKNPQYYDQNIKKFTERLVKQGYLVKVIDEDQIPTLPKKSVLFALDVTYLSPQHLKELTNFLYNGGNLLFNFTFAYQYGGQWRGPKVIEEITGLQPIKGIPAVSKKRDEIFFMTLRALSPLIQWDYRYARRMDLALYDPLPVFTSKTLTPDAVLTNWEVTNLPYLKEVNHQMTFKEAGVIWHGKYGKGNWVYLNFPSYSLLEMPADYFRLFIDNTITFFLNDITISPYPFLKYKRMVFVSEDTEYKYPNLAHFVDVAHQYDINVTAFCVARLAEKYPQITRQAAALPNVEIGSHSYSHTKIMGEPLPKVIKEIKGSKEILDKIIGRNEVVGFRPPREEIDQIMRKELVKAGYIYTMEKTKPQLLPYVTLIDGKPLWTLPRHGTDDYMYLIDLNWDKKDILKQIIRETTLLGELNGLYTLSVHTHLLSYGTNISILEEYFKYLRAHHIPTLKGKDIARDSELLRNIKFSIKTSQRQIVITIANYNKTAVKDLTFRVYTHNLKRVLSITPLYLNLGDNSNIEVVARNGEEHYIDIRVKYIKPDSKYGVVLGIERW